MSLAAARELSNKAQAGVNDRPSDNIHLNLLVKQLPQVKVDTREPPFNRPSVAKARLLLHAYLEHVEIQDPGLISGGCGLWYICSTCACSFIGNFCHFLFSLNF